MKIAFVGTGMIGAGLAVNSALYGNETALYYRRNPDQLKERVKAIFDIFVAGGACTREEADERYGKIFFSDDLAAVLDGAEFVQESIAENPDMKKEMYRRIQEIRGADIIIASSTSMMMPSKLSEGALYPEKIIVGHPYNPSYMLPLIEVCGPHAGEETIDRALEVYRAMGKEPVVCRKEAFGFIVNKISWAAMDGAMDVVKEGVCSVEDVDKAIIYGPGMRMAVTGQLLTMSLGVKGGFRMMGQKYGKEDDAEKVQLMNKVADGVDEEIANRPAEKGNTVEGVERFRDKAFIKLLKVHGKL